MYVLPLQREGQLYEQNRADITFILVMLLAVEEQVFAMLADALLKQTNSKNKEERKTKNNTFKCLGVHKKEKH